MTDQITVPRETWDALQEALQQAIGALEISGIYARRQADEFKPKSLADSIHKRDLQGIATGIATALATCRTAANAVSVEHARDAVTWTPETGYVFAQQPQAQGECDSPALCKVNRACAGQLGTKKQCSAHPQATEPAWRPIETAPKDGQLIFVRGNNWGDPDNIQHHCAAKWYGGCWMEASDWNPSCELEYLTHWMPLPAAPEAP